MIVLASSRCVLPASYLSESDPERSSLGESSDDGLCITQAYIVVDPQISGKIVAVLVNTGLEEVQEKYANVEIRDYGDDVIMPGIVDAQSCFTEPGLSLPSRGNKTFGHVKGEENSSGDSDGGLATSQDRDKCWEGFSNGTRAAAAGGITCVADFPCHGHKVTVHNVSAFHSKIALAKSQILVDMAFYALATPPNIFSTESATSLVGMLKAGAIGVVAYLTTQSMGVPGLSGHDWNMLMYKLDKEVKKDSEEVSYEAKKVPVMLSAVLMSADRHKIVDPLYMAENPYTSIVEGFTTEATPLGLDFTFGDKTNGSSSENSPVKPELADIIQKNKEEGQARMASISNLEQQRARDREKGEMPPRQLSPVNISTEPTLSQVRDSLVTTPVSGNRTVKDLPATTPDQKSRSLFDSGSPNAPHLQSARSNEGSATDLGELMSFAMDDEPEQNAVPVYMLAAPRQLRRSANPNFSESADLASAAKDSLKEMQSEFDFVIPTVSQYPLSHKDHNPIVTQVASYRTSGPSLSQRQMSLESNESSGLGSSGPGSSGPLVYGRLSPHRLSPPDTLPGSTNHSPQYDVDAESQKEVGKKEWAEVDINEINWGKVPADPPRISAALEIPLKTTESEESERNDFESFVFTPDYDITFDEIERAKSPARGLSSSVKATLLSVERKSYKYKRPTSTSSVASSSDGTDSPRINASPAGLRRSKSGNASSSNESASPSRPRVGWAESSSYSVEEYDRFWKKNQEEMSQSGVGGFNDLVKRRESSDSSGGESRATAPSSSKFQSYSAITPPTPMFYSKDGKDDSSAFSGLGSQISSSLPNLSKLTEKKKGKEKTDKGKKKKNKFRPPPIKTFKESDTLTMVAMRREYLLFLHDFPSTMEEFGISSVFTYKYSDKNIGRGGRGSDDEGTLAKRKQSEGTPTHVKTLNIHVINVSSQNGCIRISQAKAVEEDKRARLRAKKEGATGQLICEGKSDDELVELYSEIEKSHAKWPEFAEVTSSTSIYYLTHDSGMIEAGDTLFKVFPPIRRREHRLALWENINNGVLDFITSGHMPTDIDLKFLRDGDFYRAFTGMISIELMLPAFFTESEVQARENRDSRFVASEGRAEGETMKTIDSTIVNMVKFMCQKPAKFLGLDKVKGSLEVGMDADIVVWSPETTFTVNSEGHTLQSKQIRSIWDGAKLKGAVKRTFVRGKCVFERSEGGDARFPTSEQPTGMIIKGNL